MRVTKRLSTTLASAAIAALIGSTMVAPVAGWTDQSNTIRAEESCLAPVTLTTTADTAVGVPAGRTTGLLEERTFGPFDCDGKSHYRFKTLGGGIAQDVSVTNLGTCDIAVSYSYRNPVTGGIERDSDTLKPGEGLALQGTITELSVSCNEEARKTCRFNVRRVAI